MSKALKIRDLSLTLGNRLLLGGRLSDNAFSSLLPAYVKAGFYSVDVWGENVAESQMSDLLESPWQRIRECARSLDNRSLLAASLNSRNPLNGTPLPNYILEKFFREAMKSGVSQFCISDPLNDCCNLEESTKLIMDIGGSPDLTLFYSALTEDDITEEPKKKGLFSRIFGDPDEETGQIELYSDEYFIAKAKELEAIGAQVITLNDEAGMATPSVLYSLIPKLKHAVKTPIAIRLLNTSGQALACALTAIIKGIDIIDTTGWWFAATDATPPVELIRLFCSKMGIEGELSMEGVADLRHSFLSIIKESQDYNEIAPHLPGEYDKLIEQMPVEIDAEFDRAITAATENYEAELLDACHKIESFFGINKKETASLSMLPDMVTRQIVAGANLLDFSTPESVGDQPAISPEEWIDPAVQAIKLFHKVRKDAGLPPLVRPIDSALISQALALASDRMKGLPDYSSKNESFISLIKGELGTTPEQIAPAFREEISGVKDPIPFDTLSYSEPPNPELPELEGVKLAVNDEEYLLLELSPDTAATYLLAQRKKDS